MLQSLLAMSVLFVYFHLTTSGCFFCVPDLILKGGLPFKSVTNGDLREDTERKVDNDHLRMIGD